MRYFILVLVNLFFLSGYGQNASSSANQLKGRWVSEEDRKYQVVFTDTLKQDFYDGKLTSSFRYWIKKDSLVAKDLSDGGVYNYSIDGLSRTHLTLMYLQRGNLLLFRKQTAVKKGLAKKRLKK